MEVKKYEDVVGDIKVVAAAGTKLWIDPAKVSRPCLQKPSTLSS